MTDDHQAALDYLYGRLNYERLGMPRSGELKLERMRRLLKRLEDPQRRYPILHVAGTKGKGSTCELLAAALSASGRRTGLSCSPHLHRLEERFRVDGREATPDELTSLVEAIRPAVAALDAEAATAGHRGPTFFEVTTAMGLLHFARKAAEVVVLEVGMGGRLDSTNTVRPLLSVITTISFDHTRQLGNTLAAIAGEKAGIIKRGRPTISGVRGEEPRQVIQRVASQRWSRLRQVDDDFFYDYQPPTQPLSRPTGGCLRVSTWRHQRDWFHLPFLGAHQAHNASVALASLDAIAEHGLEVDDDTILRGWNNLRLPVRCEILGQHPWLVVDGAHNVASAEALAETLHACLPTVPRTLVFGTTKEKDLEGQLRALLPGFDRLIATCYVENPRAVPPDEIAQAMTRLSNRQVQRTTSPVEALDEARKITPREGLICVAGSLFLAAETRAHLLGLTSDPPSALAAP